MITKEKIIEAYKSKKAEEETYEIAKRLGISKDAVYYAFNTINGLFSGRITPYGRKTNYLDAYYQLQREQNSLVVQEDPKQQEDIAKLRGEYELKILELEQKLEEAQRVESIQEKPQENLTEPKKDIYDEIKKLEHIKELHMKAFVKANQELIAMNDILIESLEDLC